MRISDWSSDVCSSDLVPAPILTAWRTAGARGGTLRAEWTDRLATHDDRVEFERRTAGHLPENDAIPTAITGWLADPQKVATRRASELALDALTAAIRSDEHTSELQSLMRISYAVFCLKKKKTVHKT